MKKQTYPRQVYPILIIQLPQSQQTTLSFPSILSFSLWLLHNRKTFPMGHSNANKLLYIFFCSYVNNTINCYWRLMPLTCSNIEEYWGWFLCFLVFFLSSSGCSSCGLAYSSRFSIKVSHCILWHVKFMYNFFLHSQLSMILRSLKTFDFNITISKVINMIGCDLLVV